MGLTVIYNKTIFIIYGMYKGFPPSEKQQEIYDAKSHRKNTLEIMQNTIAEKYISVSPDTLIRYWEVGELNIFILTLGAQEEGMLPASEIEISA